MTVPAWDLLAGLPAWQVAELPWRVPRETLRSADVTMEETELGRPLSEVERATLETLLSVDFEGAAALRDQIPLARVVGSHDAGAPPGFDIAVPGNARRSTHLEKMAPVSGHVYDSSQEYTGEFILWLANGYLSGLEYAWITDGKPDELPDPGSIQVSVKR